MRNGLLSRRPLGYDRPTGGSVALVARLLRAAASVGLGLYAVGLLVGTVDLATAGVVLGVVGAVGNLALRAATPSTVDDAVD